VSRGIDLQLFSQWCEATGPGRLNILHWLRRLGDSWLRTMTQPIAERALAVVPARDSLTHHPETMLDIDSQMEHDIRKVFDAYATDGVLDSRSFGRCVRRLGLTNPLLTSRFFAQFDYSERHFLNQDDFVAGCHAICNGDTDQKDAFVFNLIDKDRTGYVAVSEFKDFVAAFFETARESCERCPEKLHLGYAPSILDSLCELFPLDASDEFSRDVVEVLQRRTRQYVAAVASYAFAGQNTAEGEPRMYMEDFHAWSQGAAAVWLTKMVQAWLGSVAMAADVIQEEPDPAEIKTLRTVVRKDKGGVLEAKAKAQQKGRSSKSDYKVPAPSCKFSRDEVKMYQDAFTRISSDGIMGPDEWIRCMRYLGIANRYVAERLFSVFDADGDNEMNAKEFTCGLSDICLGNDEERRGFAYRFYDLTGEGLLSKKEFARFLSKIKSQCENAVKHAGQDIFKVYGLDVTQMDHTESALLRQRGISTLSKELEEEVKLYCDDVWDDFSPKGEMNFAAFSKYVAEAPEVVDWLNRIGTDLQRMFPRLKGVSFDEDPNASAVDEEDDESLILSDHMMMRSFDKFAYPRCIDGGERTLLTVRSYGPFEVNPDTGTEPHLAAEFNAALPLSELAKNGLGGRVDLNNASSRSEVYYDTTLVVGLPAQELSEDVDEMLGAYAAHAEVDPSNLWLVDPIGDGGPDAAIVRVRTLGSASSAPASTRCTLKLSLGLDGPETVVAVTVADTVSVVYLMQWKDSEIIKKINGPNGMQNDFARRLKRAEDDVVISAVALDDASRITVSVRCTAAARAQTKKELRANFAKVCRRVGLDGNVVEVQYHDMKIVLSHIPAHRFDGKQQHFFRQAVSSTLEWEDSHITILENSWPTDDQTIVTVRAYVIDTTPDVKTEIEDWRKQMLNRLDEAFSFGKLTENLRKKMKGLQDIEASCGDCSDAVFSMRTDFCVTVKKDGLWPRFCEGFKSEFLEHKFPGAIVEDEGVRVEVIPGTMNVVQFERCMSSLGVDNSLFSRQLFRVFDEDRSGSIEVGEFIENFHKLAEGTDDDKHRILFAVHDVDDKKVVTERSLRRLFRSFFQPTQSQVMTLSSELKGILTALPASHFAGERYKTIRKVAVRKQLDSVDDDYDYGDVLNPDKEKELDRGAGIKVLESQKVGGQTRIKFSKSPDLWTSIRDRNGEALLVPRLEPSAVSIILQKNCANMSDWTVEAMVEHALRYATQPGQLQRREFIAWAETNTVVSSYLHQIVRPWMVPRDSIETAEGVEDEEVEPTATTDAIKKQMQRKVDDARQALSKVITEADIGKQLQDVVKNTNTHSSSRKTTPAATSATGVRWSRAFTIIHRSEAVQRNQIRPKTHFDNINQADVEFVFTKDSTSSYSYAAFQGVLKQLGFTNGRMVRRVFDTLCGMKEGGERALNKAETACGMLLLVKGTPSGRLQKSFSFIEKGGRVSETAIEGFLQVYQGVGLEVMTDLLARSGEVLGPKPVTKDELHAATSFQQKIRELARGRLQLAGQQMLDQARARTMDNGEESLNGDAVSLTRDDFQSWVLECPRLKQWLNRLGDASVEALSALEEGNMSSMPSATTANDQPTESTYRLLRKFPLGSHFDRITPEDVRRVFEAHSVQGRLGVEQFGLCLNEMGIHSAFSIRRLFQLFDTDGSGAVELHEFASSFLLLCGGPMESKLQKAFAMYDTDASGYLERDELQSMLAAFARVGMDAVGCSLSIVAMILGADATVENEIGRRSRQKIEEYTASLQASAEHFCYHDAVHLYYSEFVRWARQDRDFFRWLDSLRNAWIETLLEYEEHVGTSATSVCSEMLRRPKAAVPQPSPAQSFGPSNLYGFPYVVSKFYHVQLPAASGRAKRLSYSNSGLNPLQLSLHTDRADLLDFPSSRYVLGTGKDTQLRLMFLPLPDAGHRDPRRIVQ
jgi:Ca2+-binding EF-hand superfamily protein